MNATPIEVASEIRRRLGPAPELSDPPLVSIVVLNRNGADHLRKLLTGLVERTDYPPDRLELIVVDNGSSDDSLELLRATEAPFPIAILANPHNESFSDANNQGAEVAGGRLLLFLNNDIEPFEIGWLRELVACHARPGVGAVVSTLIHPEKGPDAGLAYRRQTRQVKLRGGLDDLAVDPSGDPRDLFDEGFGEDLDTPFAIGACILISSELFKRIEGFTHGYFYGGEDEDLFFKVREQGLSVIYSGRSIVVHRPSSTRKQLQAETGNQLSTRNGLLLRKRWGPRGWREYQIDRLSGCKLWAAADQDDSNTPTIEEIYALGFCLRADRVSDPPREKVERLRNVVESRGSRCLVLYDSAVDDPRGLNYDVAINVRGPRRYIPASGQLNVLWAVSHFDAVSALECRQFDLVATTDTALASRLLREDRKIPLTVLRPATAAEDLVEATLARAADIEFPTRIAPQGP